MRQQIRALSKRPVIREGAWSAAGQIISAAALLGGTRLITEIVDPSAMGVASLLLGVVALARGITCGPILQAQYRFYADFAARGQVARLRLIATWVLKRLTGTLVVLTLAAGAIHAWRTGASYLVYVALSGVLILEALRTLETNFLQAARRQKALSLIGIVEVLARPAAIIGAALLFGPTAQSVIFGHLTGIAAGYLTAMAFIRREGTDDHPSADAPPVPVARDPIVREIWRYALPLLPLAVVGWVTGVSDRYILGLLLDETQVGIYTTTYGLMSQPFLIAATIVARTMSPIYNRAVSDGDEALATRTFRAWALGTVGVCAAGFAAVVVLRHWIARFLLAEEFRGGADLMPWIAAGYVAYSVATVFEARLYARKLTGRLLLGNIVAAVASVVVPVAFLFKWGMLGVAAACPVYFTVLALTQWRLSRSPRPTPPAAVAGPDVVS